MSDDLRVALADPGYTPPRRAYAEMLALLTDPELGQRAQRALLSAGLPAASFAAHGVLSHAVHAVPAVVRLLGRALREHDAPELLEALVHALSLPDAELRRHAAQALGKSGRAAAEPALLACLDATGDPKLLRSAIEALGKVGGPRALARLQSLQPAPQLQEVTARARLMLERTLGRAASGSEPLLLDAELGAPRRILLQCRPGLAQLLADEAAAFGARVVSRSEVSFEYAGTLRRLLELRLALGIAIAWPLPAGAGTESVLDALLDPALSATLRCWSSGPLRFRLSYQGAGHRRADTWRIARTLRERDAELLNDPTGAPWAFQVELTPTPRLLLQPVGAPELRFTYRVKDVPAASHPTLAAALARAGAAEPNDVVWDPFVGSGVELIERARLGPYRRLCGTDLDSRALAAAAANVARAGVSPVELQQADARTHRVEGLTLVLTNPPMGRRVLRAKGLSGVLCQVVRHVAGQLAPGGRMVWLSPFPAATARAAADAGLDVEALGLIDLGGFEAELQRFRAR